MRILVTGASGFIGHHLLPVLTQSGHDVFPTSRSERPGYIKLDSLHTQDTLRELEGLELDMAINLAWHTNSIDYLSSGHNLTSLIWTRNFFQLISESNIPKIISIGSSAEYFESLKHGDDYLTLSSTYSKSKSEAFEAFTQTFLNTGKEFTWARVFQVFGPGQSSQRFIPTLCDHVKFRKLLRLNNPHARLDWIDVRDVADAIKILVAHNTERVIDIGTGRSISNMEICSYAEERFGLAWESKTIDNELKTQELVASQTSSLFAYFRPNRNLHDFLDSVLT